VFVCGSSEYSGSLYAYAVLRTAIRTSARHRFSPRRPAFLTYEPAFLIPIDDDTPSFCPHFATRQPLHLSSAASLPTAQQRTASFKNEVYSMEKKSSASSAPGTRRGVEDPPPSSSTLPTVASNNNNNINNTDQQHHVDDDDHHHPFCYCHPDEIHPFGDDDVNLWAVATAATGHPATGGGEGTAAHQQQHPTPSPSPEEDAIEAPVASTKEEGEDFSNTSGTASASTSTTAARTTTKRANSSSSSSSACCSWLGICVEGFKYAYSSALLVFCIVVVTSAIFTYQTTATGEFGIHPAVAFVVFWLLLFWLALMEGGLNCLVGLHPVDRALYALSHPKTARCAARAHAGDNMERFIVGRQFMDLGVVFVTSIMVSAVPDSQVLNLPHLVSEIFLGSGLAVILVTIVFGQLMTQINAAHCMLDFINNHAMVAITYLALFVEASGLLHAVYLIQILFSKFTRKPITSHEAPRGKASKAWFWTRVVVSTTILLFSLVITVFAIFEGKTTMWSGVPPGVSIVLLVFLILLTGLMEALQIAFFAVVHDQGLDEELAGQTRAKRNCDVVFRGGNLQAFLIGRQIFQTVVMFLIARIATVNSSSDENLLGVSDGLQKFFNTGLLGALFSTILASLAWRVLASSFPVFFLSNPAASIIIHICLLIEKSGVCYSAWIIAAANKYVFGYKPDEYYLGKGTGAGDGNDLELMEEAAASSDDTSKEETEELGDSEAEFN